MSVVRLGSVLSSAGTPVAAVAWLKPSARCITVFTGRKREITCKKKTASEKKAEKKADKAASKARWSDVQIADNFGLEDERTGSPWAHLIERRKPSPREVLEAEIDASGVVEFEEDVDQAIRDFRDALDAIKPPSDRLDPKEFTEVVVEVPNLKNPGANDKEQVFLETIAQVTPISLKKVEIRLFALDKNVNLINQVRASIISTLKAQYPFYDIRLSDNNQSSHFSSIILVEGAKSGKDLKRSLEQALRTKVEEFHSWLASRKKEVIATIEQNISAAGNQRVQKNVVEKECAKAIQRCNELQATKKKKLADVF